MGFLKRPRDLMPFTVITGRGREVRPAQWHDAGWGYLLHRASPGNAPDTRRVIVEKWKPGTSLHGPNTEGMCALRSGTFHAHGELVLDDEDLDHLLAAKTGKKNPGGRLFHKGMKVPHYPTGESVTFLGFQTSDGDWAYVQTLNRAVGQDPPFPPSSSMELRGERVPWREIRHVPTSELLATVLPFRTQENPMSSRAYQAARAKGFTHAQILNGFAGRAAMTVARAVSRENPLARKARHNMAGRPGKYDLPTEPATGKKAKELLKLSKVDLEAMGTKSAKAELDRRARNRRMRAGTEHPDRVAKRKPAEKRKLSKKAKKAFKRAQAELAAWNPWD